MASALPLKDLIMIRIYKTYNKLACLPSIIINYKICLFNVFIALSFQHYSQLPSI